MAYVGECARFHHDSGNVGSVTVPYTAAVAAGKTILLAVNAPVLNAATGMTGTDTKGNTWVQRAFVVSSVAPSDAQVAILSCQVTTATTTSDTITLTSTGRSPDKWAVIGVVFDDLANGFDVAATNTGTTSSSMSTGTTAAAAQNNELVFGVFGFTDSGGNDTVTPSSGYTAQAKCVASPTSAPRSVVAAWSYVNASGTRATTATLSGGEAWAGAVVAFKQPPANTPPTAAFSISQVGNGDWVSFDASASTGNGGATISSYAWTFGDSGTATGKTPTHVYGNETGTYTVTLTVTDSNGLTGSVSHTVTIATPATSSKVVSCTATGWTPSAGSALTVLSDSDLSTYVTSSSAPSSLELDVTLGSLVAPASGQDFTVVVTCDSTSGGTVYAQLYGAGGTQRSSVSGIAVPSGSGSPLGTTVALTFPWSDVQNVTDWTGMTVKMQFTAASGTVRVADVTGWSGQSSSTWNGAAWVNSTAVAATITVGEPILSATVPLTGSVTATFTVNEPVFTAGGANTGSVVAAFTVGEPVLSATTSGSVSNAPSIAVFTEETNSPPRVRIEISGMAGATVAVTRNAGAGGDIPVRSADPADLNAGAWIGYDYEAPYNTPCTYTAVPAIGDPQTTTAITLPVTVPWLVHPGVPALSQQITVKLLDDETMDSDAGVHKVVGREFPIIVTSGQRDGSVFQMQLKTETSGDEAALKQLFADTQPLLMQVVYSFTTQSDYQWVSVGRIVRARRSPQRYADQGRWWTCDCTEVDRPVGNVQAERTWADLQVECATWADVLAKYATWRGVLTGITGT